ncbi:MAG: hypothetical protein HFJ46_06525 [Clostridia bacterium]|nr:hypothetical protein [Clostridia bacterium]
MIGRDKVIICVIITIVISAILFGILMAYRNYTLPMPVYNINDTINMLKNDPYEDEDFRMFRLYLFNELSKSHKMRDITTGKIQEFTEEELDDIYKSIGGKEKILDYLKNINDDEKRRDEVKKACYELQIITDDELVELLKK